MLNSDFAIKKFYFLYICIQFYDCFTYRLNTETP